MPPIFGDEFPDRVLRHRARRSGAAMARVAGTSEIRPFCERASGCGPCLEIQQQWTRKAGEDYAAEATRVATLASKAMEESFGSVWRGELILRRFATSLGGLGDTSGPPSGRGSPRAEHSTAYITLRAIAASHYGLLSSHRRKNDTCTACASMNRSLG